MQCPVFNFDSNVDSDVWRSIIKRKQTSKPGIQEFLRLKNNRIQNVNVLFSFHAVKCFKLPKYSKNI